MADPHVDYEWDFEESPLLWEDEEEADGGDDDDDEEEEGTAPREGEGSDEDDLPLWGRPPKRVRFVQFAPGPLDTLDGHPMHEGELAEVVPGLPRDVTETSRLTRRDLGRIEKRLGPENSASVGRLWRRYRRGKQARREQRRAARDRAKRTRAKTRGKEAAAEAAAAEAAAAGSADDDADAGARRDQRGRAERLPPLQRAAPIFSSSTSSDPTTSSSGCSSTTSSSSSSSGSGGDGGSGGRLGAREGGGGQEAASAPAAPLDLLASVAEEELRSGLNDGEWDQDGEEDAEEDAEMEEGDMWEDWWHDPFEVAADEGQKDGQAGEDDGGVAAAALALSTLRATASPAGGRSRRHKAKRPRRSSPD